MFFSLSTVVLLCSFSSSLFFHQQRLAIFSTLGLCTAPRAAFPHCFFVRNSSSTTHYEQVTVRAISTAQPTANMLRNSTSSVAQNRWVASSCAQPSKEEPPHRHTLRPSDILELKSQTRVYVDETEIRHNEESAVRPAPSAENPPSQPNESIPSNYVIPQKRDTKLQSLEDATVPSAQLSQSRRNTLSRPRPLKERVVGGLAREDQLQAIWAKFDEEERRQEFRPTEQGGGKSTSGNNVLGAWEEEAALDDLDDEEGPW
jgi:hypothetical protein